MSTYLQAGWVSRFAELWESLGPETKSALLDLLPDDWSFEHKRVLDFGCGAGRTLRHFVSEAEAGEFWGVDSTPRAWTCSRTPCAHPSI